LGAPDQVFRDIKSALNAGEGHHAFGLLRRAIRAEDDFVLQARAAKLFRSIPKAALKLAPLKIAVLSSSTVDHLADALRYWLAIAGFDADFYVAPFDMIIQTVLDEQSELYHFKPDIVWLFTSFRDVRLEVALGTGVEEVRTAAAQAVRQWAGLWHKLMDRLGCVVLQNNADIPAYDQFGNIAGATPWGSRSILRLYNFELAQQAPAGVIIYDLDHAASLYGKRKWFAARHWFHSKHAFDLDAIGLVASSAARLVAAAKGFSKKCLVLDLDNTLWGGVIGDDGLEGIALGMKADGEAYAAFQEHVHELKSRGVILAVCSKNDEVNAKEPFEHHPDMRLRLSDIAVFRANWNNKVDNIREIAAILNIGIDSLVFVDDNPAERDIIRQFLPMVEVPELPEDPAGYIEALASQGYFESISFSEEDRERASYYQGNAQRAELEMSFKDKADFLTSLRMSGEVGSLNKYNLPRMAQLINKSNQFHLTGTRYSEAELQNLVEQPGYAIRSFGLKDRFGDNGLISVLVLRTADGELHVDTWVMSCRVLGRSMEEFIGNEILRVAREHHCHCLIGSYRRSTKNGLVAGLYEHLGFERISDDNGFSVWRRDIGAETNQWLTYVDRIDRLAAAAE